MVRKNTAYLAIGKQEIVWV